MNHAAVSPSTMPVGRMPQTTKSTIMATSQGMPAPEDIPLSDLDVGGAAGPARRGTMAAQLARAASPNVRDDWSAHGPSDGASLTELHAPSIESVPAADDLMAGLAEALKDVQPAQSACDPNDTATREDAPVERARPRLLQGRWR